jgi:hypothetical protein
MSSGPVPPEYSAAVKVVVKRYCTKQELCRAISKHIEGRFTVFNPMLTRHVQPAEIIKPGQYIAASSYTLGEWPIKVLAVEVIG